MDQQRWNRLLQDALTALSLSPDAQARVNSPRCLACDPLNDFDDARMVALACAYPAAEHVPALIFPNPLTPSGSDWGYVVINRVHMFHES